MKNKMTGFASIDKPQNIGHSFMEKNPIIPNMSVYNTIKLINSFYGKKTSVDCLDLSVDYNHMFNDAVTISRALKELGVKKGQIVSISMPNYYQAIAAFLACNRIGAVTTFLSYGAADEEINEYLNLFESPVFINYDKTNDENMKYKNNSSVNYIITLDKNKVNDIDFDSDYHITKNDNLINFNSLGSIANYQSNGIASNSGKDDSLILFTSGSTGKPKSVVLTNENVISSGIYMKNSTKIGSLTGEKTLVCVPFMYPYGFATSTLMTLMSSKTAILAPNLSCDSIKYYLKKNPNIVFGSPALLELIKRNVDENQDLSSIKTFISGGDFLIPSKIDEAETFFGKHHANTKICNGSGNAESSGASTNSVGVDEKIDTVGKILTGTDAIIIDQDNNKELPYGQEGLLCISGKHVFKEYYKDTEKTINAFITFNGEKYFKTGTRGFIDKDGYFTLTGRDSRYYIISTLNKIYCDRVQNIISTIDIIDSCAVVQKPDKDKLYTGKAYIVLKNGIKPSAEILEYIKEKCHEQLLITETGEKVQLKEYEIPSDFAFIKKLPKTKADKIDYSVLENDASTDFNKINTRSLIRK